MYLSVLVEMGKGNSLIFSKIILFLSISFWWLTIPSLARKLTQKLSVCVCMGLWSMIRVYNRDFTNLFRLFRLQHNGCISKQTMEWDEWTESGIRGSWETKKVFVRRKKIFQESFQDQDIKIRYLKISHSQVESQLQLSEQIITFRCSLKQKKKIIYFST